MIIAWDEVSSGVKLKSMLQGNHFEPALAFQTIYSKMCYLAKQKQACQN